MAGATGGSASIAWRSAAIRSVGAQPKTPAAPGVDLDQPVLQLGVEVLGPGEDPAGQERALQVVVGALDDALVLRSAAGLSTITFVPSTPRNAWQSAVSSIRPPRLRPTAASPSQTRVRGTAPSAWISRHQPANRSSAARVGTSTADSQRE